MTHHRSSTFLFAAFLFSISCDPFAAQSINPSTSISPSTSTQGRVAGEQLATFAGGCFWCMEPPFEGLRGVRAVISGYTGGPEKDPTYKQVSAGTTGHTEAVQITFDPQVISYERLLDIFWRSMDPTDAGGQFADRGSQYRPGIFYHDQAQQRTALASKAALGESGRFRKPIVVEVTKFGAFYPAEDYHQDYYRTDPGPYKSYRKGSGREGFLDRTWGADQAEFERSIARYRKPAEAELRRRLSDLQYRVTQDQDTEPPFRNEFFDEKRAGIYVDVVSGEPLFSSRDKFKSGTGWPSFARPLVAENIIGVVDRKMVATRTEVRSKHGDSHLGHVFEDGPAPTGLRYCINSAALRFVPVEELAKAGYGQFARAFAEPGEPGERGARGAATRPSTKPSTEPSATSKPTSRPQGKK